MYVRMYIYMYTLYTYNFTDRHMSVNMCTRIYICIYIYRYVYIYISICIGLRTCLRICICICPCIWSMAILTAKWRPGGGAAFGATGHHDAEGPRQRSCAGQRTPGVELKPCNGGDGGTTRSTSQPQAASGLRLLVSRNKNSGTNKDWYNKREDLPFVEEHTIHQRRMRDLQKLMIDHHSPQHLLGPEMWVSTRQIWWCMSHPAVSFQAIDDLERECHSLELRCCNAKEEVGRDRDRSRFAGYGSQEDFSCKTLGTQWDSTNIFCHLKALESTKELLIPTR